MTDFAEELERLLDGMTVALGQLEDMAVKAAEADVAFKVKYAQAALASERKTVSEREHEAAIQCKDEAFARAYTERMEKVFREKLAAYRASMDAVRSLMVSARSF